MCYTAFQSSSNVPGPGSPSTGPGRDVNGDIRSENGSHFTFNLAAKR